MKYKRRKHNSAKYIRCSFEKDKSTGIKSTLRKTLISAAIVLAVYAAGRGGFTNTHYIKNIISTDSPFVGEKITKLVKDAATEADVIYSEHSEKYRRDNVYAGNEKDIPKESDGTETPTPFNPLNPCTGRLSSPFGNRVHPVSGETKFHNGIDIASPEGNIVMACESGSIKHSGYNSSSGNYVIIDHGNGFTSSYAHMQTLKCKTGDIVNKGDIIGLVGSTGTSTGPHLHFEIRKDDAAVNPQEYIEG